MNVLSYIGIYSDSPILPELKSKHLPDVAAAVHVPAGGHLEEEDGGHDEVRVRRDHLQPRLLEARALRLQNQRCGGEEQMTMTKYCFTLVLTEIL